VLRVIGLNAARALPDPRTLLHLTQSILTRLKPGGTGGRLSHPAWRLDEGAPLRELVLWFATGVRSMCPRCLLVLDANRE